MTDARGASSLARIAAIAAATPGLSLLVLHGSRARGDAHDGSDWDFAYVADTTSDPDALLAALVETLGADQIDLVNLATAGALLRFRVAEGGILIFERRARTFEQFRLDAIDTWCDLVPVLGPAYERRLADLPR